MSVMLLAPVLLSFGFALQAESLQVRIVPDEAEAALAILDKSAAGQTISDSDWTALFATEGYRRLKKREESMRRTYSDADFRAFLLEDKTVAQRQALRETLASWRRTDPSDTGRKALAYLPSDARIRAKIYPVIKPQTNTFVFETRTDPAIFFYLDPTMSKEVFENTLAHELHHIGYGTCCPSPSVQKAIEELPKGVRRANEWIGAFGEGMAMLAAAGGPDRHPHEFSPKEDRDRWDRDVANFDADLAAVERFLFGILEGKLSEDEETKQGYGFFGVQGPWYTVGWRMASSIERTFGRSALIDCMRDPRKLLSTYNRTADASGSPKSARWSEPLLTALRGPS